MAYRDDVIALNPSHLYRFDNANDSVGSANGTNTGMAFNGATLITEDSTVNMESNGTGDLLSIPTSANIEGALSAKVVCGWVRLNSIQLPPKTIFREGTTGNQFNFVLWAGNTLMLDIVNGSTVVQAFSDQVLQPNRVYHILGVVQGTGTNNRVALYIDGIEQSVTEPTNGQLGAATLGARTTGRFGGASTVEVGNAPVLLNAPVNCRYGFWAFFANANANLTDNQIRQELFEKGARPDNTLTNQAQLDALANSERPDAPLCIRVDVAGDITLTANNITFNELASIHVQYTGTGTLTWINTNGANASIGSVTNGGTIDFVNPATLTTAPLIANTEVRVYEAGTTNEVSGVESSGTSYSDTINVSTVDVVIHKEDYEYIRVENVDMTQGDVNLPVAQRFDRNYRNPA